MDTIIEFKNIHKQYKDHVVLEDLSFTIRQGEFISLVGTSGCGKTTTLKLINGLITPESGDIFIRKKNIKEEDPVLLRRNIGYAIQGNVLFPHMTVEQNIAYVPNLLNGRDKERTRNAVSKWMDIVHLDQSLRNKYPSQLSGGQQQRVGIARSLAAGPDILLMDEPFGAVDAITRSHLQKEIKEIQQKTGVTIVLVTHDIKGALYLSSRIMVLDHGEIQQYDTPDTLIRHPANEFVARLIKES